MGYGVLPTHYYAVTSTLLDCIREADSEHWGEDLETAWRDGLDAVTNVMLSGAAQVPAAARVDGSATTVSERARPRNA